MMKKMNMICKIGALSLAVSLFLSGCSSCQNKVTPTESATEATTAAPTESTAAPTATAPTEAETLSPAEVLWNEVLNAQNVSTELQYVDRSGNASQTFLYEGVNLLAGRIGDYAGDDVLVEGEIETSEDYFLVKIGGVYEAKIFEKDTITVTKDGETANVQLVRNPNKGGYVALFGLLKTEVNEKELMAIMDDQAETIPVTEATPEEVAREFISSMFRQVSDLPEYNVHKADHCVLDYFAMEETGEDQYKVTFTYLAVFTNVDASDKDLMTARIGNWNYSWISEKELAVHKDAKFVFKKDGDTWTRGIMYSSAEMK